MAKMAKILLVEDDNNLREIYEARMLAEGYAVVTASDGEAALAVAAKEKPDLIISDVMMPKISGFEMLDILRNTEGLQETKVIMLTALGQAEDKTRADSLGADKYLVKSQVTLEDIVNTARSLLGGNDNAAATPAPAPAAANPAPATPAPVGTPTPQPVVAMPVAEPPAAAEPTPAAPAPTTQPTATTSAPAAVPTQPPAPTPVAAPAQPVPTTIPVATPPAPQPAAPTSVAPATPGTATVSPPASTPQPAPTPTMPPAATAPTPAPAAPPATPVQTPPTIPTPPTQTTPPQSPQAPTPTPQPTPATPAPAPTPPAAPADTKAIDDKVVSNAVEQLLANADQAFNEAQRPTAQPQSQKTPNASAQVAADTGGPTPKTPPQPVTSINGDNVAVAGKKVISPITQHETKPTLDELLAKENSDAPKAAPSAIDKTPAFTPPQPGASVTPQQKDGFDPNSISL